MSVSIMNCKSGKVMTQASDGSIQAVAFEPNNAAHRWRRVSVGDGYYAYQNVVTGNAMDHWHATTRTGTVVAKNGDCTDKLHQWREVPVDGLCIAIQNRASERVLDHYYSREVRVADEAIMEWKEQGALNVYLDQGNN